ncbi:MAG: ABC transporter substrate-binding protein [Pseudomonadota bacterium]
MLLLALLTACSREPAVERPASKQPRLVTLAPHLAELVHSAGAGDYLVGVSAYSDFPEGVSALPVVSDGFRIDAEALLASKPTLVLAWGGGGQVSSIALLEQLDIPFEVIESRRLGDVAPAIRRIGEIAGTRAAADPAAKAFEQAMSPSNREDSDSDEVSVFYQIGSEPIYTVSGEHFISDVLALCGGRNVFSTLDTAVATVSVESVVLADPEVLLGAGDSSQRRAVWQQFSTMQAVSADNIYGVSGDVLGRPSARLVQAKAEVCAVLEAARGKRTVD